MGLPGMPEDKLPSCWSDDVRMNALFAPFRIKSANPESWDMKMKFWSDMMRQWCCCKKDPIVSASDIKFAFQRKGRTPACIDIVVEEMYRNGEISPISKYQQILHNGPEGWVRWGARLAFRPAVFALTAVSSLLPGRQTLDNDGLPKAAIDSTQRFVVESAVKEQATELLHNFPPDFERIGTIEELMKNCRWQQGRETFEILLGYLVSQGAAVKKDDVVKLAEPDKKVSPVTETDSAVVKLTSAESRLEGELARLRREAAAADADARVAVQIGNKLAAKNHLRRKKKALLRVSQCEAALDNVKQLMIHATNVSVNAAIVDTYRTSSQAMKRGMQESGLDEDAVHETMDNLRDVLDSYNEIERAMGSPVEEFDAAELEQEFRDLVGGGSGGSPSAKEAESKPIRKELERDFVFDGEARILAELNLLDVEDSSPKGEKGETEGKGKEKVAVAEGWEQPETSTSPTPSTSSERKPAKPSQAWYPPSGQCLRAGAAWGNNNRDPPVDDLNDGYGELRTDDRLHPGQPLNVDFTTPPRLYNTDFQVRDHKYSGGVWLYNKDVNSNVDSDLTASTEYFSSESPGKSGSTFQMAPGGERRKKPEWPRDDTFEDLERRLRDLRGFNL